MAYQPKPVDTSSIKLPPDISELVEHLAKNTHDIWATQRLAEGWRYGEHRDDFKKEHPCLIPYERLPDSEKEYDRKVAMEILLGIQAMGYRIESPINLEENPSEFFSPGESPAWWQTDFRKLDLGKTLELWRILKLKTEAFPAAVYQKFGTNILRLGEPLLAYDVVVEGLKHWPNDLHLQQLKALALLRSGVAHSGLAVLKKLNKEGHTDEETLGLLARAHKDLATQASDPAERQQQQRLSFEAYLGAYKQTRGYWTGINAATMARLLGEKEKALELARQIMEQCLPKVNQLTHSGEDLYWLKATMAEAFLIAGELPSARNWYLQAAKISGTRYGDLSASRRNARLLMKAMDLGPKETKKIESCFRIPKIIIFAGQMIDHPGQPNARFPHHLEEKVQQRIASLLKKLDARIGYSSAACGSDILFLEAMLKRRGEINIILPFITSEFKKTSVDIIPGANWGKRFDQLLKRSSRIVIANENRGTGNAVVYEYSNLLKDGLAILRAKILDTELIPIAVWDGQPSDAPGGVSAIVNHWRSQGKEPEIIDISDLLHDAAILAPSSGPGASLFSKGAKPHLEISNFPQEIRAMLFADVVGYSRLMEEQIPDFINYFIGAINDLITKSSNKPLTKNTWGDALYCVFANVKDAGNFSLQLRDQICSTDWSRYGLPEDLNLRISLHAGPVFLYEDPLHQRPYYTGVHVSRAARIEPITPIGQVYASQQFAALASTESIGDFICDYVGRIPLPKDAGIVPLYLVRRPNQLPEKRLSKR
jgi:class 3 adenylate cyclase